MNFNELITLLKRGILEPEQLWEEEKIKSYSLADFLKSVALPIVVAITLLSTLTILLFGYRIPFTDIVVHPNFKDLVMTFISSVVMFFISIIIFGWLSTYVASIMGGKFNFNKGALLIFLISIPSLVGKIFAAIPFLGPIIAIGASIYSLVLLYKAPTILLDLPKENRTKAFLLFIIGAIVISILLSLTLGQLLVPTSTTLPQGG